MINLMQRRRAMMGIGGNSLPYDAEIEYLYGNSNQYIETGIIPDADTGMMADIQRVNTSDTYIFGLRNDSGNTRWCIGNPLYYGYGGYSGTSPVIPNATRIEVCLNYLNDKLFRIPYNGHSVQLPSLSFTPAYNIRLFGSAGRVSTASKWSGYIYAVKVTQGSNIVMDLEPVRVGTTGYMYDRVSGQLFGNAGTGDFVLGNDKN